MAILFRLQIAKKKTKKKNQTNWAPGYTTWFGSDYHGTWLVTVLEKQC